MSEAYRLQTSNILPPCKNCSKRYPACSMECEDYKAYKERLNSFNEKRKNVRHTDNDISALNVKRHDRRKKMGYLDRC
jgi:hypothetical protein